MITSMTGFGRGEAQDEKYKITVEIKSVNHRYLDLGIKLPRKFNALESKVRTAIKSFAERGKVDVFISYESFGKAEGQLSYNEALASEYMSYIRSMAEKFDIEQNVGTRELALMPEVLTIGQGEDDEDYLWGLISEALEKAGTEFKTQRKSEGENLKADILAKLDEMETDVAYIEKRAPEIIEEYREKLTEKVREYTESMNIDNSRILTEVTIYADKTCVDEETVRLGSHIDAMRTALTVEGKEAVGRRLDFIAQEMNREANTTLSKSSRVDISETAVRLKTMIEKIREQVQNIE